LSSPLNPCSVAATRSSSVGAKVEPEALREKPKQTRARVSERRGTNLRRLMKGLLIRIRSKGYSIVVCNESQNGFKSSSSNAAFCQSSGAQHSRDKISG